MTLNQGVDQTLFEIAKPLIEAAGGRILLEIELVRMILYAMIYFFHIEYCADMEL